MLPVFPKEFKYDILSNIMLTEYLLDLKTDYINMYGLLTRIAISTYRKSDLISIHTIVLYKNIWRTRKPVCMYGILIEKSLNIHL